jgi:hypothetical protein
MLQGLILTHSGTIAALQELHEKGGNNYVGVFLRRPGPVGVE